MVETRHLREECRLKVFENMILRRIFRPKREKFGEWRRLYSEERHNLYRPSNIMKVIKTRWVNCVARMEENFNKQTYRRDF